MRKMKVHINWKRFWVSRSGTLSLNDEGFFLDPESKYAHYYQTGVKSFDEIQSHSCLILLGEPCSGKSTALDNEVQVLRQQNGEENDSLIFKNLNEYGQEERLIKELFDSTIVKNWLKGEHRLNLFLDSFDQALFEIPKLAVAFQNRFQELKGQIHRVSLRLACRTGCWPESLTDQFNDLWGSENVGVYELAPLRQKDVKEAAEKYGLDSESFICEIKQKEIQSLASHPVTLNWLLREYAESLHLQDSRTKLFFKGCQLLSNENNSDWNSFQNRFSLPSLRRLALASRIAAVMVFCNRSTVQINSSPVLLDQKDLPLSMLQEGEESTGKYMFAFSEKDLLETETQTALFSSRGPNLLGFAHKSFETFLAAHYLSIHQLPIEQIKSLIQLSNDPGQMVIPQLKETAAWLNTTVRELIEESIKTDPQSMLSGDLEGLEGSYRRDLVASLLKQFEGQQIIDTDWGLRSQYPKLKHPELASQLEPYIRDKTKHFLVRRVAIDIAEACEVRELQSLLAEITLDSSDSLNIRDQAGHAVSEIADNETRLKLKPLVFESIPEDLEDKLKGHALTALWPKHLNAKEVFDNITPLKNPNLLGSYAYFLSCLPDNLEVADIPIALNWVKKIFTESDTPFSRIEDIAGKVLFRSWHNLSNNDVLDAYAETIIPRLENYQSICPAPLGMREENEISLLSDNARQDLIKTVVKKLKNYRRFLFFPGPDSPRILYQHDLEWMVQELCQESDPEKREIWAKIIRENFSLGDAEGTNEILQVIEECSELAEMFKDLTEAVELNSDKAQKLRESHKENQRWKKRNAEHEAAVNQATIPPISDRIMACLERLENGDYDGWWQLCFEMIRGNTSNTSNDELTSDLTSLPSWKNCEQTLQTRIIEAAKKYILEKDANPDKWLGTNIYYRPAVAGYKAFILLNKCESEFLISLEPLVWKKWAPVFLGIPERRGSDENNEGIYSTLMVKVCERATDEIVGTLMKIIDRENKEHEGNLLILRRIENCLNSQMKHALLEKAKDLTLKPLGAGEILSLLLKANDTNAKISAMSLLTVPLPQEMRERAKQAALSLLTHAEDAGWDSIWTLVQEDAEFGKEVFMAFPSAIRFDDGSILSDRIGEEEIGDLFLWLNTHFPRGEDPVEEGAHFVGDRESLTNFRDGLLEALKSKGTSQAIKALENIGREFPELNIKFYLVKARERFREKNWSPLLPDDFLSLTKNSLSRLVLNSEQLVEALIESLRRLEKKLQGETPTAIFLWDQRTKNKFRPKSENDFSDYIKSHLIDDLGRNSIVALREVEIRRRQGKEGSPGERTDIYVAGLVAGTRRPVKVIIEVKGCWHREVNEAMETQLLNRYLNETGIDHGIYLVGWYCCHQWDKTDTRKNKTSVDTLGDARKKLEAQASLLSSNGKIIKTCVVNCSLR